MSTYYFTLSLHVLGATIWAGGHLTLAMTILPDALKQQRAAIVSEFEQRFERIGIPALAVQIITGLWLAHHLLGSPDNWLGSSPVAHVIQLKLALLAMTLGLALHARLRVIPNLSDETLASLAWHIRAVTLAAVLLVLGGASIRFDGYPAFRR
jgi:putative copper export protein